MSWDIPFLRPNLVSRNTSFGSCIVPLEPRPAISEITCLSLWQGMDRRDLAREAQGLAG